MLVLLLVCSSHSVLVLWIVWLRRISRREEIIVLWVAWRLRLALVLARPAAVLLVLPLLLLDVVGALAYAVEALADAARVVLVQVLFDDALLVDHLLDWVLLQLRERQLWLQISSVPLRTDRIVYLLDLRLGLVLDRLDPVQEAIVVSSLLLWRHLVVVPIIVAVEDWWTIRWQLRMPLAGRASSGPSRSVLRTT